MSQAVNIMYILIHSCDICNIYYLLLMLCCALVLFWVGDYPLSVWLLNTSIYIFSLGANAIGGSHSCILTGYLIKICICTSGLNNASVELCNSFLSINLILNTKASCIASHSSCSLRSCAPTICYVNIFVIKLIKDIHSFYSGWLCTPDV